MDHLHVPTRLQHRPDRQIDDIVYGFGLGSADWADIQFMRGNKSAISTSNSLGDKSLIEQQRLHPV
jgi:hypothetical protein